MTTLLPVRLARSFLIVTALASVALLSGCSIKKIAGDQVIKFSEDHMVPYLLTFDDTGMACASGEALTPLLLTLEDVGSNPDQLAVMVYIAAGLCAESEAANEELRYLRAMAQQNITEAQDARIAQKRWHALAAQRQYAGYKRLVSYYGEPTEGRCPKLGNDFDEFIWMVGLIAGVQSALNDGQSDRSVGVPLDIAPKVERGAACLKSDKWWDLPLGIRASLWNLLPMTIPPGTTVKPMDTLAKVAKKGEQRGVRLGHALWAISAYGNGDKELTKNIIRDFAASGRTAKLDPNFRMMDAMAAQMLLTMSDRLWTEATGVRTPVGGLGTFWDDRPKSAGNIDDLL